MTQSVILSIRQGISPLHRDASPPSANPSADGAEADHSA